MCALCVVYTYLGAASTNNLEFMQNANNEHLSCGQTRLEIIARMVIPMLDSYSLRCVFRAPKQSKTNSISSFEA